MCLAAPRLTIPCMTNDEAESKEQPRVVLADDDPIIVEVVDGHLLRDGNEFYPISGESYYVPATGAVMRFSRDSTGTADAMLTDWGTGQKTRAARVQRRP